MKFHLKPFIGAIIALGLVYLVACEQYEEEKVDFSDTVDPYVASYNENVVHLFEGDTGIYLYFGMPNTVGEDVEVPFFLKGDAKFNVHYFIDNVSDNSGTIKIEYNPNVTREDIERLKIIPVENELIDTASCTYLIMQFGEAITSSGEHIHVGEDDELKEITLLFHDNDCSSNLEGSYNSYIVGIDSITKISITKNDSNSYLFSNICAHYFNEISPPKVPVSAEVKYFCDSIMKAEDLINMFDVLTITNISGVAHKGDSIHLDWVYKNQIYRTVFKKID
ncbi:MAG: hypothetical protein ACOCUV_00670 [bacterium]